ncbi:MAG: class I SAM-dependent methyltransferase [bacterium]
MMERLDSSASPGPASPRRATPAAGHPDRWPIAGRGANALFRAAEAARPAGERIVDDPYAARFSERTPSCRPSARAGSPCPGRAGAGAAAGGPLHRHRALDVLVEEALGDGYTQIVTLGAGYDTRPLRLGGGARWFEVDAPETAAEAALSRSPATTGGPDPGRARPRAAGIPRRRPASSWRLIHYLPVGTLDALLAQMGAGRHRRVLLSFIDPAMVAQASVAFASLVKLVREAPASTSRRPTWKPGRPGRASASPATGPSPSRSATSPPPPAAGPSGSARTSPG